MLSQIGFDSVKNGICGYLVDRGYLVLADSDELRKVQYAAGIEHYRSDVLELILLASEDCNFRCTYCYEHFKRGTMQPHVREGIKHLVNNRLNTLRQLKVSWFGGEPLYGMKTIEDLAPFFARVAADHDLKFASHMTTNAYLLSENVVDRLFLWGINDFQVTVDGMPEDHDSHRPTRDGRGTFQTIFDNLLAMKQRTEDFTVVIRVNFDRKNSGRLEEFLELVQKTFQNDDRFMLSFHAVGKWADGPNDAELITCGLEKNDVRKRLCAIARTLGLKITGENGPHGGTGSKVCYAARPYNFIIGASGKLMKCTIDLDKSDHNVVGQLLPNGELELNDDKMALWTEPAFQRDTGCQICHMLPACQGVNCPKIRIDEGRRPCPTVRQNGKRQMVEHFLSRQSLSTPTDQSNAVQTEHT